MKKYSPYFATFIVLLFFSKAIQAQIVTIPDANFKSVLVADNTINTNQDSDIQVSEAQTYNGSIDVSNSSISNMAGIEAFVAITSLDCSFNQLSNLDVSANTSLTNLVCLGNQITALDLASNSALSQLDCGANQLSSLITSTNTALTSLICNNNQITALDLTNNIALTKIFCSANQLLDLQASTNVSLDTIICSYNTINNLDVSSNNALIHLECQHNTLATIDLGTVSTLERILCFNNNDLATLDLSTCSALLRLEANFCQLQSLDLSNSPSLIALICYDNQLEYLNIRNGNNLNVTDFDAQNNPLLFCIMVDSVAYSNTNWALIDPASSFAVFCTALGLEEITTEAFQLYPNPTSGVLNVRTTQQQNPTRYQVFNLQGKEMASGVYQETIQLKHLSEGLYWIQFYKNTTVLGGVPFKVSH